MHLRITMEHVKRVLEKDIYMIWRTRVSHRIIFEEIDQSSLWKNSKVRIYS